MIAGVAIAAVVGFLLGLFFRDMLEDNRRGGMIDLTDRSWIERARAEALRRRAAARSRSRRPW